VKRQGGFSMVELMVAITLALLLTGAVISVFVGSRTAFQATAGVGEMSDSGRFALNLIGESVRSAGNLACNSAMTATSQNVSGGLPFENSFGQGVDALPNATTLTVTPVSAAINNNGYAAVADCTKSVIFQASGGVAAGATVVTLNNPLQGVGFSAGAVVAPLTTTVYYIGVGSDGDSSLWRLEQLNGGPGFNPLGPEELVPDVENMQVLYGIDPSGTQTASAYVTGDTAQALGFNVVSIQVALLVASQPTTREIPQPAAGFYTLLGNQVTVPVDNRMRQVFYATINLRDAVN